MGAPPGGATGVQQPQTGLGLGAGDAGQPNMVAMMNDPMFRQMMQQMMSNPDMVEAMMMQNPQTRELIQNHPEVRERLRDPAFLQTLSNPDTLQAMLQLQTAMQQSG